jgi:hypothetical protein
MPLERELETIRRELPGLLKEEGNRGKFALIHADEVDSIWETLDQALEAGYERFDLDQFLVKEITDYEQPKFFSRRVSRCP